MSAKRNSSTVERFWLKVDKSAGDESCWDWQGSTTGGYGTISRKAEGKPTIYVHRFSYELHIGEIPAKMYVCHRCDNPSCVNPSHLFLGTHEENMHDKGRKGRGRGAKGITNGAHKLTESDVIEIRRRYAAQPVTRTELAIEYGVSDTTIRNIVLRKQWVYLADN